MSEENLEATQSDNEEIQREDEADTDLVAAAAAALGDAEEPSESAEDAALEETNPLEDEAEAEDDSDAAYRKRLREFTRELKKQPGQWYIIQTYSSYENKVKTNLEMRAQTLEVEDDLYEVVVPVEQVTEMKDGKKKVVKHKLLPGYVLVRMEMNDATWSVVRGTPGVTSFVGNEGNATVVKPRDVAKFLMPKAAPNADENAAPQTTSEGEMVVAMPEQEAAPKLAHDFEVGDAVTILSGALASVSATISEIDPATGKIQALVSIFGRETPVEVTPDQIEKII